jgi:hypothetical protein
MLCEDIAPTPFELGGGIRIEAMRCELDAAVDDIQLALSADTTVAIQAKHQVGASESTSSPLASALTQFVHAWIDARDGVAGRSPMREAKHRLVLACGPDSVTSVRRALPTLLRRFRDDPPTMPDELRRTNRDERRIWPIVLAHLRRAFEERDGHPPGDDELTGVLSIMRVQEFEFDGSARDAERAQTLLAQTVLVSGAQAGAAWDRTVSLMLSAASGRRGLQRERLAQLLAAAGLAMRPAPSYRADVDRLREATCRSRRLLGPLSEIRLADSTVKIPRPLATVALDRAQQAPCLVIAEPGGGKSGVIADAIDQLERDGRDVVALLADRYTVADDAELSEHLGLEHRLADVLAAWPGDRPGVLAIDGLDAARGGDALAPFTTLIEDIASRGGRWTVLASIRTFDLRYSPRLQDVFRHAGAAPEFTAAEFAGVHHLHVPGLDDHELAQAGEAFPPIAALLDAAPQALRELVRNPFNLARLAELLQIGAPEAELRPLRTQLQLLDVYWRRRVRSPQTGVDARERLARALCEHAVDALALFAPRTQLAIDAPADAAIAELLTSGVLVETQSPAGEDTLAFSHHVLFDYALARLMLRVDEATLAGLLRERPELAVVARPSLTLHFQWCWEQNRELFWRLTFALAEDHTLPLLARATAPAVAAQASSPDDLTPLTEALAVTNQHEGPREALVHVIGSVQAAGSPRRPLQDAPIEVWTTFADRLSEHLDDHIATQLRILTWRLLDEHEGLTDTHRASIGRTGRRLLRRALEVEPGRSDLVYVGINAVAATFDTDATSSKELLAQLVTYERIETRGWEELDWLIEALFPILDKAPDLLAQLYKNAFAVPPPDKTTVTMGGPVMPLSSNRAQDFGVSLHALADRYPRFLRGAPGSATGALISICTSLAERRPGRPPQTGASVVRWRNREGRVIDDYSIAWDHGSVGVSYRDEETILGAYQTRLEELADADGADELGQLLDPLAGRDVPAVIWRRILDAASRHPQMLGPMLADLLASAALLGDPNVNLVAELALAAAFAFLTEDQRAAIEHAIISLPDDEQYARRRRTALLLALPEDLICTDTVRRQRAEGLVVDGGVPEQTPWPSDFLDDARPQLEREKTHAGPLAALTAPVQQFAQGNAAADVDWATAAREIRALDDGLRNLQGDDSGRSEAEGWLTTASIRAVTREPLPADDATAAAAEILLRAASDSHPSQPDDLTSFDHGPHFGFPAGRVDAARGLMALAKGDRLPAGGLNALQTLASDANAAVRLQIARHLHVLIATDAELTWQLAEQLPRDPSGAVRESLLNSLARLTAQDRDRALDLIARMFDEERARANPHQGFLNSASKLLIESWVHFDAPQGRSQLDAIAADPGAYTDTARATFFALRTLSTYGEPEDLDAAVIRRRAIEAFTTVARGAMNAFQSAVKAAHAAQAKGEPVDEDALKAAAGLVGHACTELYFASGAYPGTPDKAQTRINEAKRDRFYAEADELIDILCDAPLPPAAHHVMQTLECFIRLDPRGVLLRTGRVLQAAHAWNYQHDQMALSLFVGITQRYLAEHRDLLTDTECRTTLLASLEFFVAAGWPEARRLVYRLDEAFR